MPYKDISDLPKAQTDQYDRHQKEAFDVIPKISSDTV